MSTEAKIVDLGSARTDSHARVFAGRARGTFCRQKFKIEALDEVEEQVTIVIPADVISLNISFFLSFLGESVRKLGKDDFKEHYKFECDPILVPLIDQGIDQALKRSNALVE
jgi:hypothetical protein